jgi:isovaleryl-CoA dehydrogenase
MRPFPLGEELDRLRESVRAFADKEIAPRAEAIDRDNQFPLELWPMLGGMGLLGITIPEELGGSGMGYLAHVIAMEEISRASGSVGLSYGAHSNLCVQNPLQQRQRRAAPQVPAEALQRRAQGRARDERAGRGLGRGRLHGLPRRAARRRLGRERLEDVDHQRPRGRRARGLHAHRRREQKSRAMTAFIVERGMKGFRTAQKLDKFGMRGSNTCELVFEDCEIPDANVLGQVNQGVQVLMSGLNTERLVLSGGPLGLMQAAMDAALPYVRERKQFDQPIGSFGIMQAKIADMYTALQSSRAYAYMIAMDYDRGEKSRIDPASCLLHASQSAVQVGLEAIQCLGGNGYINEYPTGRILRDAKLYEIGAGTNEIRRMLIGRELVAGNR